MERMEFDSGEFESSPETLRQRFDDDAKDLIFPGSFSVGDVETEDIEMSRNQDFSVGGYFQGRSSFPSLGVSDNAITERSHLQDLPERDDSTLSTGSKRTISSKSSRPHSAEKISRTTRPAPVRRTSSNSSITSFQLDSSALRNVSEHNETTSSIRSLNEFFSNPNHSPLSSSAILNHVMDYCRDIQDKTKTSLPGTVEKKKELESLNSLTRRYSEESRKRDSGVGYHHFSSGIIHKTTSRCSTPEVSGQTRFASAQELHQVQLHAPPRARSVSPKQSNSSKDDDRPSVSGQSAASFKSFRDYSLAQPHHASVVTKPLCESNSVSQYHKSQPKRELSRRMPVSKENRYQPVQQPISAPQSIPVTNHGGLQLQLNVPQQNLPPNFPATSGPLVINIMCPTGNSSATAVSHMNNPAGTGSGFVVHPTSNQQYQQILLSNGNPRPPQIAIQFSGTIQFNP